MLFDLANDPHESVDVADDPAYGDRLAELDWAMQNAMERGAPPLPFFEPEGGQPPGDCGMGMGVPV